MASTIEIQLVGSSIGVRNTTDGKIGSWEYYPVSNVVGVTGTYTAGIKASSGLTYPFADMCIINIDLSEANTKQVVFDVQRVTNQAGWTANLAGVNQALADINTWINTVASPSGGATAANQVIEQGLIGSLTETAPATDTASSGLNGRLQRIAQRITSLISSVSTSANQSTQITLATDALGGQGTDYIFGTGVVTGKVYKYLVVNADATFTTLTDSAAVNLLTNLGISGTVTKGMIIRAKGGKTISAVTLATGSVTGVL